MTMVIQVVTRKSVMMVVMMAVVMTRQHCQL